MEFQDDGTDAKAVAAKLAERRIEEMAARVDRSGAVYNSTDDDVSLLKPHSLADLNEVAKSKEGRKK